LWASFDVAARIEMVEKFPSLFLLPFEERSSPHLTLTVLFWTRDFPPVASLPPLPHRQISPEGPAKTDPRRDILTNTLPPVRVPLSDAKLGLSRLRFRRTWHPALLRFFPCSIVLRVKLTFFPPVLLSFLFHCAPPPLRFPLPTSLQVTLA